MSVSTPKVSVVRLLAIKVEATTGTEESVTATEASLITYDAKIERDKNTNDRQQQAGKGQAASVAGIPSGTATFDVELASSGTAGTSPAWALQCLPACDMTETAGTWSFANNGSTVTIALYEDGAKRVLYGARGSFKITRENGKPARCSFTYKGKYKEDADASILAPTFPTTLPDVDHDTLTVGSFTPILTKAEVDAANDVSIRENMNATDGTGMLGAAITNRKPSGMVTVEQGTLSSQDWNNLVTAGTVAAFSWAIGATAGNICTIASAACQVQASSRTEVSGGLLGRDVTLQFNGTSAFTIAFS